MTPRPTLNQLLTHLEELQKKLWGFGAFFGYPSRSWLVLSSVIRILKSPLEEEAKKEILRRFLDQRWREYRDSRYSYTENPNHPQNKAFLWIARAVAKPQESVLKTLMPTVQKIIAGPNMGSLLEDETVDTLSDYIIDETYTELISISGVAEFALADTDYLFNEKKSVLIGLTSQHKKQLMLGVKSSKSKAFFAALKKRHQAKLDLTFGRALKKLEQAVLASSVRGKGNEDEANLSVCTKEITHFYQVWKSLPGEIYCTLKEYRLEDDRNNINLESYLLYLFAGIEAHELLTPEERIRVQKDGLPNCTSGISSKLNSFLTQYFDDFYAINLSSKAINCGPTQHELSNLCQSFIKTTSTRQSNTLRDGSSNTHEIMELALFFWNPHNSLEEEKKQIQKIVAAPLEEILCFLFMMPEEKRHLYFEYILNENPFILSFNHQDFFIRAFQFCPSRMKNQFIKSYKRKLNKDNNPWRNFSELHRDFSKIPVEDRLNLLGNFKEFTQFVKLGRHYQGDFLTFIELFEPKDWPNLKEFINLPGILPFYFYYHLNKLREENKIFLICLLYPFLLKEIPSFTKKIEDITNIVNHLPITNLSKFIDLIQETDNEIFNQAYTIGYLLTHTSTSDKKIALLKTSPFKKFFFEHNLLGYTDLLKKISSIILMSEGLSLVFSERFSTEYQTLSNTLDTANVSARTNILIEKLRSLQDTLEIRGVYSYDLLMKIPRGDWGKLTSLPEYQDYDTLLYILKKFKEQDKVFFFITFQDNFLTIHEKNIAFREVLLAASRENLSDLIKAYQHYLLDLIPNFSTLYEIIALLNPTCQALFMTENASHLAAIKDDFQDGALLKERLAQLPQKFRRQFLTSFEENLREKFPEYYRLRDHIHSELIKQKKFDDISNPNLEIEMRWDNLFLNPSIDHFLPLMIKAPSKITFKEACDTIESFFSAEEIANSVLLKKNLRFFAGKNPGTIFIDTFSIDFLKKCHGNYANLIAWSTTLPNQEILKHFLEQEFSLENFLAALNPNTAINLLNSYIDRLIPLLNRKNFLAFLKAFPREKRFAVIHRFSTDFVIRLYYPEKYFVDNVILNSLNDLAKIRNCILQEHDAKEFDSALKHHQEIFKFSHYLGDCFSNPNPEVNNSAIIYLEKTQLLSRQTLDIYKTCANHTNLSDIFFPLAKEELRHYAKHSAFSLFATEKPYALKITQVLDAGKDKNLFELMDTLTLSCPEYDKDPKLKALFLFFTWLGRKSQISSAPKTTKIGSLFYKEQELDGQTFTQLPRDTLAIN